MKNTEVFLGIDENGFQPCENNEFDIRFANYDPAGPKIAEKL